MMYGLAPAGKQNSTDQQRVTVLVGSKFASKQLLPLSRPNSMDQKGTQLKTQGSCSLSFAGDSLSSSKASLTTKQGLYYRALNNEPITHQRDVEFRNEMPSEQMRDEKLTVAENVSFAKKKGGLQPTFPQGCEVEKQQKPLSIEFRYRQLEFECSTLKETVRSLEQREANQQQWRANKLKEAHDKIGELSRKLQQQASQLHSQRLARKKQEAEINRLNNSLRDYESRLQQAAQQAEQSEHIQRRALERLSISHKDQIERLESRERSIANQLQSSKQKRAQLQKEIEKLRESHSGLTTELAEERHSKARGQEQNAAEQQKQQLEKEALVAQLSRLQADSLLSQARFNSEFKQLKSDFDNAVNVVKVKDRTVLELTEKLQALEVSSSKQLEDYKHSRANLQARLSQFEQELIYETTVRREQLTGERSQLQTMLRELASVVDTLKHQNSGLRTENQQLGFQLNASRVELTNQLTETLVKLETLQQALSVKISEIEALKKERAQLLDALEGIPGKGFHLQQPKPPLEERRAHRTASLTCRSTHSLDRLKLLTEPSTKEIAPMRRCSPVRGPLHQQHKLTSCSSARQSIVRIEQPHQNRPYFDREEETLNQAILRRCQLIIGERYGPQTKRG